jgi:hypothetical protein
VPLDGLGALCYLTAGTRYSDRTGLAEEWVIVKHFPGPQNEQQVEWVIDLEEFAAGESQARTPMLPMPIAPAAQAAVRVRGVATADAADEAG